MTRREDFMKTTKLVPVTPIDLVVVPKPKRGEIIAALVEVARKEHADKLEALNKERAAATDALEKIVAKKLTVTAVRKQIKATRINTYQNSFSMYFEFKALELGPEAAAANERKHTADNTRIKPFDELSARREIIRRLDGAEAPSERVAKLASSEAIAALWKHIQAA
jgi:hypothetical protein